LLLILISTITFGHQTGLSYIEIDEDVNKKIKVIYKKPLLDINLNDIVINYPNRCEKISENLQTIEDGFVINSYELWCLESGLIDTKIWIEGLNSVDRGFALSYTNVEMTQKALLRSTTPFIHIGKKSSYLTIMGEYILLGISHILLGYDHLLFVLALLLLAKNRDDILNTIASRVPEWKAARKIMVKLLHPDTGGNSLAMQFFGEFDKLMKNLTEAYDYVMFMDKIEKFKEEFKKLKE